MVCLAASGAFYRYDARMRLPPLTLALALTLAVAAGCGGDDGQDQGLGDDTSQHACTEFRTAAQDQTDGVLTADELRDQLQEVQRFADAGDDQAIADAASGMVAALTTNGYDSPETATAVTALSDACTSAGY